MFKWFWTIFSLGVPVILPLFGEGRFPTGVLQPNIQWLYNNHSELELLEPPNKDGCLGSFHENVGQPGQFKH